MKSSTIEHFLVDEDFNPFLDAILLLFKSIWPSLLKWEKKECDMLSNRNSQISLFSNKFIKQFAPFASFFYLSEILERVIYD